MWPLDDITVYYYGSKIKDAPEDWTFRNTINYISDYYHNSLEGYKPPKTGRICISIEDEITTLEPNYFGAICTVYTTMNEETYLKLNKPEQYKYLLDLIHDVLLRTAGQLNWNKTVFESAYRKVMNSNFQFERAYDQKKSRDQKKIATAILHKTEDRAIIKVKIEADGTVNEVTILDKKNWFWYDSSYKIAKACKWIDKDTFGYSPKNSDKYAFYSLERKEVETNMQLDDSVF